MACIHPAQELRVQEQSLEKMKLHLDQWDELLREKEKKLKAWVSTREAGSHRTGMCYPSSMSGLA